MKKKIGLLARGIFEHENPEIVLSDESIKLLVEAGKTYEGRFIIDSINDYEIRTKVFSSHKLMKLQYNDYIKTRVVVEYTFDATELAADDVVDGHFSVISNGGEYEIPYHVVICQPYCHSSMGDIKDLEQFTELAKVNWHEALKIFKTEDFKRVFLQKKNYAHIYELLVQSRNMNQAMEEFLCTTKQKQPVGIRISQDSICVENAVGNVREHLVIEKDNWGYKRLKVSVLGDFLSVYKRDLTTEDFLGSYYELEYIVKPDLFKYGHNYGKIIVETVDSTIEIPVTGTKLSNRFKEEYRKSLHESVYELYSLFLKYEMTPDRGQILPQIREAVDSCRNRSTDDLYILYEAHYNLLSGQHAAAGELLDEINGRELRHQSMLRYCYYAYLMTLFRNDENYTHFIRDKIDSYFESNYRSWQLLWIKLELEPKTSAFKKFHMIKSVFGLGARSPFMYLKALEAVTEDPSLLREFGDFETQLVTWAVRNGRMTADIINQYADIAASSREYSELALNTLITISEKKCSKAVVAGICAQLIRGGRVECEYNSWYRRGIEASIRLQGLYENYMKSLDMHAAHRLPASVLLYFNYNNHLNVEQKAYLYAYVVTHKTALEKQYADYENIMKAFTYEQLGNGLISEHMVVLYKHFIAPDRMNTQSAAMVPEVIFKQEVHVNNPWMREVIVSHRDVNRQQSYEIRDGHAYIDIYMDEYYLIFVDQYGLRYSGTIHYDIRPLFHTGEYVRACAACGVEHDMVLLNRCDRGIRYQKSDDISIDIYKRTLRIDNVGEQYKKTILNNLIDYYYDNYEGETLEKYLLRLDISIMDRRERGKIIEYYIQRGLFDMAFKAIKSYGYDYIQDKKVMRLCSRKIKEMDYEADDLLIEMAYYAFSCGKYDDTLLNYLIRYYLGTTKVLYEIWVAATNFEVDTFELDEEIICQMLFTETPIANAYTIFEAYYRRRPDQKLVKAFLANDSYKYLVLNETVDERLFKYLEIEYDHMSGATDICCLALLKYYSESETLIHNHEHWIVNQVEKYIDAGMVLPFFKKFAGFDALPDEMLDRVYVTMRASQKHKVIIRYSFDPLADEASYIKEEMKHVVGGLFTKSFVVYCDETLTYMIDEYQEDTLIRSESGVIEGCASESETHSSVSMINDLISLYAMGDLQTAAKKLQSLEEKKYLANALFTLIQ